MGYDWLFQDKCVVLLVVVEMLSNIERDVDEQQGVRYLGGVQRLHSFIDDDNFCSTESPWFPAVTFTS